MAKRKARLLLAGALLALACRDREPPEGRYIAAARQTGKWLRSVARATPAGLAWPVDALRGDDTGPSLATGGSGPVLFFLALHQVGGDPSSLDVARSGARQLLASLPGSLDPRTSPPATSLYGGAPGVAVVLGEVGRATGQESLRDGSRRVARLVASAAVTAGDGAFWSPLFDDLTNGNAGTALFLVWASSELDDPAALPIAERAGRRLAARGVPAGGGRMWRFREDRPFLLPNFSHGTAGVAYVLATLGLAARDSEATRAAVLGARYLESIADRSGGGFFVPYGFGRDEWARRREIGWAHGPAGTVRLFERLQQVSPSHAWEAVIAATAAGLLPNPLARARGLDGEEPSKFDLRFGAAGAIGFLVDRYEATGDERCLAAARQLGDAILERSFRDARGIRWREPRRPFMDSPGEPAELTGLFHGASGYGLALLRLAATERKMPWGLRLPDDPGWRPRDRSGETSLEPETTGAMSREAGR
jgi:hypothetical protein